MDGTSFCYRIGDLAIGRALSITPGGLLVKLPGQDAPALLPHQVARHGVGVGDELCDLLVVQLYPDERFASVVVPEAAAEELVASADEGGSATSNAQCQEDETLAQARSRGRWGAPREPQEPKEPQAASRLMPFLVSSRAAEAAEAPSYASVAMKPSHAATSRKAAVPKEEPKDDSLSVQQLLQMREVMLTAQDAGESAASPLPTSMPCRDEELDRSMLQMVISTRQLPAWWARCSRKVKHQAFRVACRTGRLNIMKAIYCADGIGIDTAFLTETLKEMCADAQGAADVKVTKKPKRSEDSKGAMGRVAAQATAAWTAPGGSFGRAPAAQAAAWLVEQGAPVELLLPESGEAFPARLRGLKMLAELGPSIRDASEQIVVAVAGCLRDPEVSGRRAAADTLAQFGLAANQAPRALPRLLRLVQKDEDVAVREAAARALGSLGPEGVAAVMQLGGLDAEDAEVQGLAALALGHSGPAGAAQADRLAQLLEGRQLPLEEAIRLRLRAAQALGARADLASEADLAALAKGLQKDTEEMVREACCIAIGQIGQANKGLTTLARVSLEPGLSDAATFVQEAAADALAHLPQLGAEDFDEPQSVWQ
ncbi:unnamed protein product [Effrenium voratum]|nr:unnamed protein product [Effrenium voratum]